MKSLRKYRPRLQKHHIWAPRRQLYQLSYRHALSLSFKNPFKACPFHLTCLSPMSPRILYAASASSSYSNWAIHLSDGRPSFSCTLLMLTGWARPRKLNKINQIGQVRSSQQTLIRLIRHGKTLGRRWLNREEQEVLRQIRWMLWLSMNFFRMTFCSTNDYVDLEPCTTVQLLTICFEPLSHPVLPQLRSSVML